MILFRLIGCTIYEYRIQHLYLDVIAVGLLMSLPLLGRGGGPLLHS